MSTESVASVGKTFAILDAIGQCGPVGISALAQRLDMSKTTVHRLLQTLRGLGYVEQESDTERYRLTSRLFQLGAQALEHVDLVREADKEMRQIAQQTGLNIMSDVAQSVQGVIENQVDTAP